jgi:radical SAM protein with 4Fe4S-binding SPASM domain
MNSTETKIRAREENNKLNEKERNLQKEILKSYPVNVILPTGTKCNNRCIFCTDRSPQTSSHYSDLSFDRFVRLCEPLEYATSVGLYGWGEPLLNPDYGRMFNYVVENFPGIEITVSTNGILLNGGWIEKFVSCENISLNISLNASNAKTYKLLAQNDQFDRITENIQRLIDLKKKENTNSPEIVLSFVAIKENIIELPAFVRLASRLGVDRVVVQDLILLDENLRKHSLTLYAEFAKSIFLVALKTAQESGVHLIPFVPVYYLPIDSNSFVENEKIDRKVSAEFCIEPWIYLRVSSEGEVKLCCYSEEVLGNLNYEKMADLWNGEKYRYFRRKVNSDDLPEDCKKCPKKLGMTV